MKKSEVQRRRLLSVLAASGSVVIMPRAWMQPIVDSIYLPAHAVTTGCITYAVEEVDYDGAGTEPLVTICAIVCDGVGQVHFQTSQILSGPGRISFLRRDGEIPVGGATGNMIPTFLLPCGDPMTPSRSATLTNQTETTITYTMNRGGMGSGNQSQTAFVIELQRVEECPNFLPLYCASAEM